MTLIPNMLFFNTDARSHQTLFGNVPGGVITLSLWRGCAAQTLKPVPHFRPTWPNPIETVTFLQTKTAPKLYVLM